jgi:hypothetical protein
MMQVFQCGGDVRKRVEAFERGVHSLHLLPLQALDKLCLSASNETGTEVLGENMVLKF